MKGVSTIDIDWGKKNLGNTDRIIRIVIGFVLLGLALTKVITGWWAALAVLLALFQFYEAYAAY